MIHSWRELSILMYLLVCAGVKKKSVDLVESVVVSMLARPSGYPAKSVDMLSQ